MQRENSTSDPGQELIDKCHQEGTESALTAGDQTADQARIDLAKDGIAPHVNARWNGPINPQSLEGKYGSNVTLPQHDFDTDARTANVYGLQIVRFKPKRRIQIREGSGEREIVDFSTNGAFDLNRNEEVIQGAINAVTATGVVHASIAAARASTGQTADICSRLADMKGGDSRALLYPTTLSANAAAAFGIARMDSTAVVHPNAHATVHLALAGALPSNRIIRTKNVYDVGAALASSARRPIVTVEDGLYSMGNFGDFRLAEQFLDRVPSAMAWFDDAHSMGLCGEHGRGAAMEHMTNHTERCIVTASLAKTVGAGGGFLVGPKTFIRRVIEASVPDRFSCNLDIASQGAVMASLQILACPRTLKTLQGELNARLAVVDSALSGKGIHTEQEGTFIPFRVIYFGGPEEAISSAGALLEQANCLTTPVFHPTIARGAGAIRISISVGHTLADIEQLIAALLPRIDWRKAS